VARPKLYSDLLTRMVANCTFTIVFETPLTAEDLGKLHIIEDLFHRVTPMRYEVELEGCRSSPQKKNTVEIRIEFIVSNLRSAKSIVNKCENIIYKELYEQTRFR
jgi:hypothetical protein